MSVLQKQGGYKVSRESLINQRDTDLKTINLINKEIGAIPKAHFILTGSYSIEALTGVLLEHEDIDANILSSDTIQLKAALRKKIPELELIKYRLQGVKETPDRLEFNLNSSGFELSFFEITSDQEEKDVLRYTIKGGAKGVFRIPTVLTSLRDSHNNKYVFRVKSLSYAIATWLIRISGVLYEQKRPVRNSDFEHLSLLLAQRYKEEDILEAMRFHPQMPHQTSEKEIFCQAFSVLKNFEKHPI